MGTAEDLSFSFNAIPAGLVAAMRVGQDKRVNGALETVEGVALAFHFEVLVVIISANFTFSQCSLKKRAR